MALTTATMDEIAVRVNCYGVGAWLDGLLQALGLTLPSLSASFPVALPRSAGLTLRIDSTRSGAVFNPLDRLFIISVEGDGTGPAPFGLDPAVETIATARTKLSSSTAGGSPGEIAAGDRRVSFFIDGGRVVELRFRTTLTGFDRIVIARLGIPQDWRGPISR